MIRSSSSRFPSDGDPLEAAERGAEAAEPGDDVVERGTERARRAPPRRARCRRCRGPGSASSTRRVPPGVTRSKDDALEPVQLDGAADDVERRPRVPAGGAAVVAEVADVRRRVLVRRAAAQAVLRVGGVLERRPGEPRIVEPEDGRRVVCAREVGDLRVVAVHDERGILRQPGDGAAPALRDELELAVAVELVAEEVAEQDRPGPRPCASPRGARASSTSNRPSSASRAERRVEATPETRFAPERLCASRKRGRRISAAIAAVVVFPFVADTIAAPAGSRAASRSIAPGSSFESSLPGTVVPPPAPASRERAATARAATISAARGTAGRTAPSVRHAREGAPEPAYAPIE